MKSKTHPAFWIGYNSLPSHIQRMAKEKYDLWLQDEFHPSLQFKEVQPELWSVRINMQYRALARRRGDLIVWFWIGPHAEYDRLIQR